MFFIAHGDKFSSRAAKYIKGRRGACTVIASYVLVFVAIREAAGRSLFTDI